MMFRSLLVDHGLPGTFSMPIIPLDFDAEIPKMMHKDPSFGRTAFHSRISCAFVCDIAVYSYELPLMEIWWTSTNEKERFGGIPKLGLTALGLQLLGALVAGVSMLESVDILIMDKGF